MAMNSVIKAHVEALGPGVSDTTIAATESELGHVFPEAYRGLLRAMNGCVLLDGVFHRPRSPEHPKPLIADVHIVMGIGHKSAAQDLLKANSIGDRAPNEAFAFASDSGGNSFILYTRGPRRGEVAFRDHEGPFREMKLADSIDEFFAHLVDAEAPDVLADFPPVVGHAVKIVARKTTAVSKKPAAKKPAAKKTAAKKTAPSKTKGAAKKTARKTTGKKPPAKSRR